MALPPAGLWGRGRLTAAPGRSKFLQHLPMQLLLISMHGDPNASPAGPTQMDPLDGPPWTDTLDRPLSDGPSLMDPMIDFH